MNSGLARARVPYMWHRNKPKFNFLESIGYQSIYCREFGANATPSSTHIPTRCGCCYPAGSYNYLGTRRSIHIGLSAGYPTEIVGSNSNKLLWMNSQWGRLLLTWQNCEDFWDNVLWKIYAWLHSLNFPCHALFCTRECYSLDTASLDTVVWTHPLLNSHAVQK